MDSAYVQARDGNLYLGSNWVTLETVILGWQAGQTPEQIHASFPQLPLVAIYDAITYYLERKDELDAFFRATEAMDEARQAAEEAAHPRFFTDTRRRMAEARQDAGGHKNAAGHDQWPAGMYRLSRHGANG